METAESLIAFCTKNKRICPQPQSWNQLYELLPNKRRIGNGWEPPLPSILAAWWDTPTDAKQMRLAEHIKWAEENGKLLEIAEFLSGLEEKDWYHFGE